MMSFVSHCILLLVLFIVVTHGTYYTESNWNLVVDGQNSFDLELPACKRNVKIKLLSQRDQSNIDKELKGYQVINRLLDVFVGATIRNSKNFVK